MVRLDFKLKISSPRIFKNLKSLLKRNNLRMMEIDVNGLNNLPYEILLQIFSYLKLTDLKHLKLVSKRISVVSSEPSLWRNFLIRLSTQGRIAPRVCHSAVVYKNLMYVYGGHLPDKHTFIKDVKNDLSIYNFEKRKWSSKANKKLIKGQLPEKTEHTAVLYKQSMYIFGGYSVGPSYSDINVYKVDLETYELEIIEAKEGQVRPFGRSAHSAVVWKDYMYVFGGWDGTESNNSLFKFNFLTHEWTKVTLKLGGGAVAPPCIRSHSSVVHENLLYIIGGYGPEGHPAYPYCFDLVNEQWHSLEQNKGGPCARSRLKTVVYGNNIYCLGGWNRENYYNDFWRFNLLTKEWEKIIPDFELQGIGQYSLVQYQNQIYIYGGYNPSTCSPQPNIYTYIAALYQEENETSKAVNLEDDKELTDQELLEKEKHLELELIQQQNRDKLVISYSTPIVHTASRVDQSLSTIGIPTN